MSKKEQFLKLYRHEQVEKTPNAMECVALVGQWSSNEYGERNERIRPDVSLDEFGCEWYHGDRAPVPVPDVYVLDDVCDWRDKVTFPDVSSWDWEALAAEELPEEEQPAHTTAKHAATAIAATDFTSFIVILSVRIVSRLCFLLCYRIGYRDLMIVPIALRTENRNVKRLVETRHGDIEPIHLLRSPIVIGHRIGSRQKSTGLVSHGLFDCAQI